MKSETLAAYAGNYSANGSPVVVSVKEDHLTMKVGARQWDLYPDSERTFFRKDIDAYVDFQKGPGEAVTGLVSHIGPEERPPSRQ